jgi:heme/copper-type cytochrome/quinol oxidase subunit 2
MPIVIKAVSAEDYKAWVEQAREEFATVERPQTLQLAQAQ